MELKTVVALLQEFENNEEAQKYIIDGASKEVQEALDDPAWVHEPYYYVDHGNPMIVADMSSSLLTLINKLDKALQDYLQNPQGRFIPEYAQLLTEKGYKTEPFVVTSDGKQFGIMVKLKHAMYVTH